MITCAKKKLVLVNVVWGEGHSALMVRLHLPSICSPGNIPWLSKRYDLELVIYVDEVAQERLEQSKDFRLIRSLCHVVFRSIQGVSTEEIGSGMKSPYKAMNDCHQDSVSRLSGTEVGCVFLSPDCVLSANSFSIIGEGIESGAQLIATVGIRLDLNKCEDSAGELEEKFRSGFFSGREMVRWGLQRLHPTMEASVFPSPKFGCPSALLWRGENCLVVRAFHCHPFFVGISPALTQRFGKSIDDAFVNIPLTKNEDIIVLSDSDQFCVFELSPPEKNEEAFQDNPLTIRQIVEFMHHHTNPMHRYFALHNIFLHTEGSDVEAAKLVMEADTLLGNCFRLFDSGCFSPFQGKSVMRRQIRSAASRIRAAAFQGVTRVFKRLKQHRL